MRYSAAMPDAAVRLTQAGESVLGVDEAPPFEVVNRGGAANLLLICDHASRLLPRAYDDLGLEATQLRRHLAWDIGAADVTRRLAAKLDAPAVLSGYSRLIIDCNRALDDPTSIVVIGDGVVVGGNRDLATGEAERRADALYRPYHRAIGEALQRFAERGVAPALISIHSFTPTLDGIPRPWHIGILWDRDPRLARPLLEMLRAEPALCVGDNRPYSGRHNYGYSIVVHGARAGLPHVLIEIRQDLIEGRRGAGRWADLLASVIGRALSDPDLFRIAPT